MKRTIYLTALFASVLLLSACSYRNDFVVVNQSGEIIEVQYTLKQRTPDAPGKFVNVKGPAKLSLKEFNDSSPDWREVPKEQHSFDNVAGTFKVNVAPDEVLLLDFTYNYSGSEGDFNLASISINGAKGSIKLEGRQAQTQFRPASNSYVIEYK